MKRALVTGGSGSVGGAICLELAARGLHVLVHASTHLNQAAEVVEQIVKEHGSAEAVGFDVTEGASARIAIEKILEAGPIQVLVHSAGVHDDAPMAGMTVEQWTRVIAVSLHGFFNVAQPLLLPMIRTRWGRIVVVSSITGLIGNRGQTNYSAAKAGLHGAVKSLALEVASRGITVNAVAPGLIQSPMTEGRFSEKDVGRLVPMRRMGTPEEVAALVQFLTSDRAGYISGQVVSINGGLPG